MKKKIALAAPFIVIVAACDDPKPDPQMVHGNPPAPTETVHANPPPIDSTAPVATDTPSVPAVASNVNPPPTVPAHPENPPAPVAPTAPTTPIHRNPPPHRPDAGAVKP